MNIIQLRQKIRQGIYQTHTSGVDSDCAQYNVVILEKKYADDFQEFCEKNQKPCPIVARSEAGNQIISRVGDDINLATDIPKYCIFKQGELVAETTDILSIWQDDLVGFLLGCSFTFEKALIDAEIDLPHVQANHNVAMYNTNIELDSVGRFSGNMVVSMRYILEKEVDQVISITRRYPHFHGEPIHIGDPGEIGINTIESPDYGEYTKPTGNRVAVFWACGVTPQLVIKQEKLPLVITHKPGHMLIGDISHQAILSGNY